MAGRPRKEHAEEMQSTSFSIPKDLHTEFKIQAVREGRDMGVIVAELLKAYLVKTNTANQSKAKKDRPKATKTKANADV